MALTPETGLEIGQISNPSLFDSYMRAAKGWELETQIIKPGDFLPSGNVVQEKHLGLVVEKGSKTKMFNFWASTRRDQQMFAFNGSK